MARRRKNAEQENSIITLDVPAASDLSLRLQKISKQTGLSPSDLVQKWLLQEEFTIGLMSYVKKQGAPETAEKTVSPVARKTRRKASPVKAQEETATGKPEGSDYRDKLADRAKKLKSEGWTLKKISDAFNDEKISTISGTGKWYTSSITWLLKSSK